MPDEHQGRYTSGKHRNCFSISSDPGDEDNVSVCVSGLKRPHNLEPDEDSHIHNMKRSREEGPQLEVRCLIQSKVGSTAAVKLSYHLCAEHSCVVVVVFQNAGAIIGKAGANIKRLRNDVSLGVQSPCHVVSTYFHTKLFKFPVRLSFNVSNYSCWLFSRIASFSPEENSCLMWSVVRVERNLHDSTTTPYAEAKMCCSGNTSHTDKQKLLTK